MILMLKKQVLIILFASFCSAYSMATNIKGQVNIDASWEPLIYLSVINSFDDLNTASYDFLIYQAKIDSLGYFEINDIEIPNDEMMYRLHICKKGDPVSTIIIGGKNENFIHFIMKNGDNINIVIDKKLPLFRNSIAEGHTANESLRELFRLRKNLNSPPELPSAQKRLFLRQQIHEDYCKLADTSSHSIIRLMAIYFVNESFASTDRLVLMENIQDKTEESDTSSPYYKAFIDELTYLKFQNTSPEKGYNWLIWALPLLILMGSIAVRQLAKKKQSATSKNEFSDLMSQLSVQEKRVLDLLKEGKSNKEIATDLHIEVSTVKSHLNKIYSRLGVKSRKEIVNSDWQ